MNKKELALLEKAFALEIDGALNGYEGMLQTKNKLAEKLVSDGLLFNHTIRNVGAFTVVAHGYLLTHAGRSVYCMTCEDEGFIA